MESASLPALVETLILGCVLSKANSQLHFCTLGLRFAPSASRSALSASRSALSASRSALSASRSALSASRSALSATPNLALTSNLDSQFATLGFPFRSTFGFPSPFHLRLPFLRSTFGFPFRSTFGFPFRSALSFPTLGLPRCYAERCLTLYVRNHAPPPYAGSRAGLARAFNYPANALSVIYIHSESIQTSNIRAQLNQALPNIRPQKA